MEQFINRRERERHRHRQEILDTAEKKFAENGFHKTTMEEIACEADFSVGTMYNLFASKDDLYQSLIEQRFTKISEEINAMIDLAGNPLEAISLYIKGKILLSNKYRVFAKLYTRERLGDRFSQSDLWTNVAGPLFQQLLNRLSAIIKSGINVGQFRSDINPFDIAVGIDGLSDGFMYEWLMNPDAYEFETKFDPMMKMISEGVCVRT